MQSLQDFLKTSTILPVCLLALAAPLQAAPMDAAREADLQGKHQEARTLWLEAVKTAPADVAAQIRNQLVILDSQCLGKTLRHYPAWAPDQKRIMCGYGGLVIVEVETRKTVGVESPTGPLYAHDWAPDGLTIACRQLGPDKRPGIFLYERAEDNAIFPTYESEAICEGVLARFSPTGKKLMISAAARMFGQRRVSLGIAIYDMETGKLASIPWKNPDRPARNHGTWAGSESHYVFHA